MNYAVIKLSGSQYKVSEGQVLKVNKLSKFEPKVLMASVEGDLLIGAPYLTNVQIKAEIERQEKGEKVTIRRFKAKSRYHKTKGFRQTLSVVKIVKISSDDQKPAKKEAVKEASKQVADTQKKVSKEPKVKKEAK